MLFEHTLGWQRKNVFPVERQGSEIGQTPMYVGRAYQIDADNPVRECLSLLNIEKMFSANSIAYRHL
jgi:hypothetical protein